MARAPMRIIASPVRLRAVLPLSSGLLLPIEEGSVRTAEAGEEEEGALMPFFGGGSEKR